MAFEKAIVKIYGKKEDIPAGTDIEIGNWKDLPQIEILGSGEDERCAFCKYFRQIMREEKTKRNNCPF